MISIIDRRSLRLPRDLRDDRGTNLEEWFDSRNREVGNSPCRDSDPRNVTHYQIIWFAWKPNYIVRRRFVIDLYWISGRNRYLAKSWRSNARSRGSDYWRAMILRWFGIQQVMALDDPRLHTAHLWILPVPRPARTFAITPIHLADRSLFQGLVPYKVTLCHIQLVISYREVTDYL